MASKVVIFFCLFILLLLETQCFTPKSWIRVGYYHSPTELPVSDIKSELFTHLIFAFTYIDSSSHQLSIDSLHSQKFYTFSNTVKRKNPSVKTILSIWVGGEQASVFFSMLTQSSYRKSFIKSSIKMARLNGFHGLDLYGVEPSSSLEMKNLGTLLGEWRVAIDSEARSKNRTKLVLIMLAHPRPSWDSASYPFDEMKKNLDWIHLKTYDYYKPTLTNFSYHHAALYDPLNQATSTNNGIQEWVNIGLPASKLVLGLPYHGFAWTLVRPHDNPIGAHASGPGVTLDGSMNYNFLKWYIRSNGYGVDSVYDDTYVVNLCKIGRNWINFDDVEATRAKVSYAKKMGLLGYFAFHIGNDDNWALSRAGK